VLHTLQYCRRATVLHDATTHTLFTPPSSPLAVMPSNIVALSAADAEVLKQRLDALVIAVEAVEKAVTACRRVLATRQLLDEE
jgi:hypothetical protein